MDGFREIRQQAGRRGVFVRQAVADRAVLVDGAAVRARRQHVSDRMGRQLYRAPDADRRQRSDLRQHRSEPRSISPTGCTTIATRRPVREAPTSRPRRGASLSRARSRASISSIRSPSARHGRTSRGRSTRRRSSARACGSRSKRSSTCATARIGDTNVIAPQTTILTDAGNGQLADVTWVTPSKARLRPPGNGTATRARRGWLGRQCRSAKASTGTRRAIIVLWDDWGGWYDNAKPPQLDYRGLGFRVPCLIISPYAKPATLHTSIRVRQHPEVHRRGLRPAGDRTRLRDVHRRAPPKASTTPSTSARNRGRS